MGRRLSTTVLVQAPPGGTASFATFGPDDTDIPDWASEQMGDHVWEGNSDSTEGPPPQSGKGSGKDAWVSYADSLDVDLDEDATREEIVAAVAAAGYPTE